MDDDIIFIVRFLNSDLRFFLHIFGCLMMGFYSSFFFIAAANE